MKNIDYVNLNDEELVGLSQKGDAEAMSTVVERYKGYVKILTRSFYITGGDSEDLLQEGMLGVFKAVSTFNGKSSFKSYAYLCIKSNIITAIKKSNREKHKPLNNALSLSELADGGDKTEFSQDKVLDPETQIIDMENAQEFENKLDKLLSCYEKDILSYYLKGLSYAEISIKLDKSVKSIDNALQRIRKKISGEN